CLLNSAMQRGVSNCERVLATVFVCPLQPTGPHLALWVASTTNDPERCGDMVCDFWPVVHQASLRHLEILDTRRLMCAVLALKDGRFVVKHWVLLLRTR